MWEVADAGADGSRGGGVYGTTRTGAEERVDDALEMSRRCDEAESVFVNRDGMLFGRDRKSVV